MYRIDSRPTNAFELLLLTGMLSVVPSDPDVRAVGQTPPHHPTAELETAAPTFRLGQHQESALAAHRSKRSVSVLDDVCFVIMILSEYWFDQMKVLLDHRLEDALPVNQMKCVAELHVFPLSLSAATGLGLFLKTAVSTVTPPVPEPVWTRPPVRPHLPVRQVSTIMVYSGSHVSSPDKLCQ